MMILLEKRTKIILLISSFLFFGLMVIVISIFGKPNIINSKGLFHTQINDTIVDTYFERGVARLDLSSGSAYVFSINKEKSSSMKDKESVFLLIEKGDILKKEAESNFIFIYRYNKKILDISFY